MPDVEYEFTKNEDWHGWDYGEADATVINFGATREGLPRWEDGDMYYHWWTYEYVCAVQGSDKKQKFTGEVKFVASGYGAWFKKYPKGFKFLVRYNKADPTQHSRMNNFD